ncbi:hypothetical protein AWV80_38460 [Cupriavidus sp. UYMU48A]|nr:hypothetical protein AWV80_38460 [Cupriavidus sp. UYMU48A]
MLGPPLTEQHNGLWRFGIQQRNQELPPLVHRLAKGDCPGAREEQCIAPVEVHLADLATGTGEASRQSRKERPVRSLQQEQSLVPSELIQQHVTVLAAPCVALA